MKIPRRGLSVLVGVTFAFSVIIFASPGIFSAIAGLITLLAFNEFLRMYHVHENRELYAISIMLYAILTIMFLFPQLRSLGFDWMLMPLAIFTVALVTQEVGEERFAQIAVIIAGAVYVGFLLYLVFIRLMPQGREMILVLVIGTWGRNIGAAISGRLFRNGHTMLPKVNSRKTYEGSIGGLVFTLLLVSFSGHGLVPNWTPGDWIAISFLIGILGQVGDLVESWLKRNVNMVDSSQLLPGQGGILDSVDSLIFTAPALYFYLGIRMSIIGLHG